jgi:hypothetical protein
MSMRATIVKVPLYICATLGVSALMVLGGDRLLPLVHSLPVYTPSLSTVNPPNTTLYFAGCDFNSKTRTNSLGLRGPEVSLPKTDKFRIVVIGSSYVFGWGVDDDACFVRLLESGLRAHGIDAEVVNLGRNGGTPGEYALLAEEMLPLLKPDLMIVAVVQGCDLEWSGTLPSQELFTHRVWTLCPNLWTLFNAPNRPPGGWGNAPSPVPEEKLIADMKESTIQLARRTYDELSPELRVRFDALEQKVQDVYFGGNLNVGIIKLSMYYPLLFTKTLDLDSEYTKRRVFYLGKHLHAIAHAALRQHAPTLVLSVPLGPYVNEFCLKNSRRVGFESTEGMLTSQAPDEAIRRGCGDLPFFSATDEFRRQSGNPNLYFELDLHLSTQGHALFSQQMLPWVEDHVRAAMNARKK